jgi:hypothetical protein
LDTQHELEVELARLQQKYGRGKELTVEWMPSDKTQGSLFGMDGELYGEVLKLDRKVCIYCSEHEDAMHTLRHEFFEYMFETELIGPYVELYNQMYQGFEKAFAKTQYTRKEALIEILVEREEESLEKGDKKK